MRDLSLLKYFLGVEVARSLEGIFLCQQNNILDINIQSGLLGARRSNIPMEQNHHLTLVTDPFLEDAEKYMRLVGRLIYLSFTPSDLTYVVHILSQFMEPPRQEHWAATLRTVHYLKGYLGQGILLRTDCGLQLTCWCDLNWANYPFTRPSLTGWPVFQGHSPVS